MVTVPNLGGDPAVTAGPPLVPQDPTGSVGDNALLSLFVQGCEEYAIYGLDPHGRVASWNPGAERLKGYRQDDILGRSFSVFYPPEAVLAGHPERVLALAVAGGVHREEGWRVRRDGSRFWAEVTVTALRDEAGELRGFAKMTRDLTERRAAEARLTELATHDPLTGLPNRSLLLDRLEVATSRLRRSGGISAVLFIDVDGFREVNDTWGHRAGDQVLTTVAGRIRSVLRAADTLARIGADEFVVVCEGLRAGREAAGLAARLGNVVSRPIALDGAAVTVTCSIGIAIGDSANTADELLRNADDARFEAKQRGRAQYRFHERGRLSDSAGRLKIREELREGIAAGQLALQYQPIVDLDAGGVVALEALVRWDHPVRGRLAPGEFLPIAESDGLIVAIGDWVLRQACSDLRRIKDEVPAWDGTVAVNVSAHQLGDPRFVERVLEHLDGHGIGPTRLCLETTESVLVRADELTRRATRRLVDKGVQLAIDDFGTGYASLSYLRDFPFGMLKIDRTFTSGLGCSPVDEALVRSVLSLADTLDLPAVTEGVETPEQLARLRELGGCLVQGFLLGRPSGVDDVIDLARQGWAPVVAAAGDGAEPVAVD